jgi:hypothetical protein
MDFEASTNANARVSDEDLREVTNRLMDVILAIMV